jgi:CopG family transcriptional regulator / antitoxin EndoAI
MGTSTVNISFKKDLLQKIDSIARQESRTRSELVREAARMYIERKQKWKSIFAYGQEQVSQADIDERVIDREIKAYRKTKRR